MNIKVDLRGKNTTRDKESHFLTITGSIHQEDITVLNIYAPDNRNSKDMKQKLIELHGEIDTPTIIVEESGTLLSTTDRASRQKISATLSNNLT